MIIDVNGKDDLVQALKASDFIEEQPSVFSEASTGTLTFNQYFFNEGYGALQIKSDSKNKGALSIKAGRVNKGEKIKISCELYSINGVMPKVTIDYHTIAQCKRDYWKGTSDVIQLKESGKFIPINVEFSNPYDGFAKVVIGLFGVDSGEFFVRNVHIESHGCQVKRSIRAYNINQQRVVAGFGFDTAKIEVDNSQKFMKIKHDRPFTTSERGIAFANVDAGSTQSHIVPRTRSQYKDHVIVEFYDMNAKDTVAPNTLNQYYYFSLVHIGFDYEGNDF